MEALVRIEEGVVKIEETVYVWMFLDTDGSVMKVAIAKSSGNAALDSAATAAAWKHTFFNGGGFDILFFFKLNTFELWNLQT